MQPTHTAPILTPPKNGPAKLMPVLAVIFGLGTLVFGVLAVVNFNAKTLAERTKADEAKRAEERGKALGKAESEAFYKEQIETPFRRYTAPEFAGRFAVIFPKNWNVYSKEAENSTTQIELIAHPDFVIEVPGDNAYALRVSLIKEPFTNRKKTYDDEIKNGKLKSENITVSGISGVRLTGKYDNKHDGVLVLIPVRDKTLTIATDDKKYLPEYEDILKKADIKP
jgi:hypothetical protein